MTMEPDPGTLAPPARRHLKKRVLIPGIILTLLVVLLGWAAVRGTWADTVEKNPSSSREGPLAQLYQAPDGHKMVRCALVVDRPLADIWAVVTDYDHFHEIFPYLQSCHGAAEADGRYH